MVATRLRSVCEVYSKNTTGENTKWGKGGVTTNLPNEECHHSSLRLTNPSLTFVRSRAIPHTTLVCGTVSTLRLLSTWRRYLKETFRWFRQGHNLHFVQGGRLLSPVVHPTQPIRLFVEDSWHVVHYHPRSLDLLQQQR